MAVTPRKSRQRAKAALLAVIGILAGGSLGFAGLRWSEAGWPGLAISSISTADAADRARASLCIANVHDGDTIRTCDGERVRIENIDAPEMPGSPKCEDRRRRGWCDYALAERSRDELAAFLASGPVSISPSGTDVYGRTLATLSVNGQDAGRYLVSRGLARVWR